MLFINVEFKRQQKKTMGRTPREIRELGTEAVRLYNAAIDQGHYVNDLIRCMFVGHHGVGKTTLVKTFLADKDKRKPRSTDGIDVHIRKCYFDKDTDEWHVQG